MNIPISYNPKWFTRKYIFVALAKSIGFLLIFMIINTILDNINIPLLPLIVTIMGGIIGYTFIKGIMGDDI